MEKLIELLNEFRPTVSCANFKEHYEFIDDDVYLIREGMDGEEEQFPMYICYKKGDFIKWLVENEKIDRVEVWSEGKTKPTYGYTTEPYTTCKSIELENTILMVLAIQDEPIEFLVSILK